MLADVERVEVVSGPGGTLWGANAVNGVINVITRSASETSGVVAVGNYGDVDRDASVRVGLTRGEDLGVRLYGKSFDRGHSINSDGSDHIDGWRRWQVGFRSDWSGEADALTVQGDLYRSRLAQAEDVLPDFRGRINGADVLARWSRRVGESSSVDVQAYYDRTRRDQRPILDEDVDTWNVSAQHRFALGSHSFVWGTGFRQIDDSFADLGAFAPVDEDSRRTLFSVFLQDQIRVTGRVSLTAGLKLEDHTYTGLEYMPNVRLALQVSENALWWAAVSRAVRTPSRIDRELQFPGLLVSNPDFASETLLAYEVGFRGQPIANATVSVSAFFNRFDDLRTTELSPGGVPPAFLANGLHGDTYGVELNAHVGLTDWWRLSGGITAVRKDLEVDAGVTDISNLGTAGNDPSYHLIVRSLMAPLPGVELDVGVRSVEDLDSPAVPGYTLFDARIGWTVLDRVDLVGTAFNLFDDSHPEAGEVDTRREIRRSLSVGLRLRS
jgi:iron complex outermembrane receptor protein